MPRPRRSFLLVLTLPLASIACAHGPSTSPPAPAGASETSPVTSAAAPSSDVRPPVAARRPVVDEYHGVRVTDDYRWLEDPKDPEVQAWSEAQNRYARARLDAIPFRPQIKERATRLLTERSADYFHLQQAGGKLFALKLAPPKQQPVLVVLPSADDPSKARVVLDPTELDPSGGTTIDLFVPSRDGKSVAVSLSKGGTESGDLHVYDVATGKPKGDFIPRVYGGTAGGSFAWNADGSGLFYTRYPRPGERPDADLDFYQQVYFHQLGQPAEKDTYAFGKELPRIAEISLSTSPDGQLVLASVENGDGGDFAFYLFEAKKGWRKLAGFEDDVVGAAFAPDGSLYLVSRKNAPMGKVVTLPRGSVDLAKAKEVIPQGPNVIERVIPTETKLYVMELDGGPSRIRVEPRTGAVPGTKPATSVAIPPVSAVNEVVRDRGDRIYVRSQSYLTPPAWYAFDPASATLTKTALRQTSIATLDEAEVVTETCTSKDGTKVPLRVVRPKGARLDGTLPTLLTGYGGFNVTRAPRFRPIVKLWVEQGGVFAEANLRGGGEYGDAWHEAGRLVHKQNVFDDFAACASHLVEAKYTTPERLAIMGGSNGGLLMGATLTQHPTIARAVVALVGIYDMLRVELTPNGAFNATEYGSVKNRAEFEALYAYSPYHRVADGTAYPAALFLTGANDPRVDPFHSRKMVARLQAANTSGAPILLRTSNDTGHGAGTPLREEIEQQTDVYSFLFDALRVPYRPVE